MPSSVSPLSELVPPEQNLGAEAARVYRLRPDQAPRVLRGLVGGAMLRQNTWLRREYLYRKSLEGKERQHYEKKRRVWEALEEGKPIPTELRNEEHAQCREINLDGQGKEVLKNVIDDEYTGTALREPKILLTTSRNPSVPLTQFVKELKVVFPNSQRMNRGQVQYVRSYQKLLSPAAHMRSLILFWCMNIVVSAMV